MPTVLKVSISRKIDFFCAESLVKETPVPLSDLSDICLPSRELTYRNNCSLLLGRQRAALTIGACWPSENLHDLQHN